MNECDLCDRQKNTNTPGNSFARFVAARRPSASDEPSGAERAPRATSVRHFLRLTDGHGRTSPLPPTVGEGEGRAADGACGERAESFSSALSGAAFGRSVHHVDSSDIQWRFFSFH